MSANQYICLFTS